MTSKQHNEEISCPKCGEKGQITIWESVNVTAQPELREKLLDESMFLWKCPHCGNLVYVTFGFLYHDANHQFMLFFDHHTDNQRIEDDPFPEHESLQQFNKNYVLRYVYGVHALKEKIFIFEEGLSDIVIEILKYFVRNQVIRLDESDPNFLIGKGIYFTHRSDDNEQLYFTVFSPKKGPVAQFALSMDMYEKCLQKYILDEGFKQDKNYIMNVCYDWIDAKLKSAK